MKQRGRFITLEGIEGVGKTTQVDTVRRTLQTLERVCRITREPGGTPLAEDIRALVLAPRTEPVPRNAELLLMFAARAVHVANLIEPTLTAGEDVVCDRFTDATYAYQGGGRGVPLDEVAALERITHGQLQPDLTLLLAAPPELALRRARNRGTTDRFEAETLEFFARVRATYLQRAQAAPGRFQVIDATRPLEEVTAAVATAVGTACRAWTGEASA
ncbi:MAG: dTMP kinase [Gammaproteobacteria bacterium]